MYPFLFPKWPISIHDLVNNEKAKQAIRQECTSEQMRDDLGAPFLRTMARIAGIDENQTKHALCMALSERLNLGLSAEQIRGIFTIDDLAPYIEELKMIQDPITGELMTQPIILAPCGHTFDLSTISRWLQQQQQQQDAIQVCPIDRIPVLLNQCIPNHALRSLIPLLMKRYGVEHWLPQNNATTFDPVQPVPSFTSCKLWDDSSHVDHEQVSSDSYNENDWNDQEENDDDDDRAFMQSLEETYRASVFSESPVDDSEPSVTNITTTRTQDSPVYQESNHDETTFSYDSEDETNAYTVPSPSLSPIQQQQNTYEPAEEDIFIESTETAHEYDDQVTWDILSQEMNGFNLYMIILFSGHLQGNPNSRFPRILERFLTLYDRLYSNYYQDVSLILGQLEQKVMGVAPRENMSNRERIHELVQYLNRDQVIDSTVILQGDDLQTDIKINYHIPVSTSVFQTIATLQDIYLHSDCTNRIQVVFDALVSQ